jgi:xanthine dehydrogenase accessory factor
MAGLVIALGPGFVASQDVHAVVETNRGPYLGRVYWSGTAQRNTGQPGAVMGKTASRVLRAPGSGRVQALRRIGEIVHKGEVVARVNQMEVCASFTGLLRGMIREGLIVSEGMKIGDIDPRLEPELVTLVSDKALAVAGGVLEAAMMGLRHNRV